jgi:hypothetical protein
MQISKSEYMLFLKHPGMLWLKKHDKSKLPAVSESLQAMFDDGKLFEEYANKLFPDAVSVGFDSYASYMTMPNRTREILQGGAHTIFQGRIESENITCIFDVIEKVGEGEYDLIEVKSSTEVKSDHIADLAFQTIVLEDAGLKVRNVFVIHANAEYVRRGDIDVQMLTKKEEVTAQVRSLETETRRNIEEALRVASSQTPPDYSPRHAKQGALQEWMEIYHLLYPQKHTYPISKLTRINAKLIGELEDRGVERIQDIPESVNLSAKQRAQVHVTRDEKRIIIKEKISEFLDSLIFPLYFFDYETFSTVIPPFDGIHPHQQVPFQYSLHIMETPTSKPVHKEYLHRENSHPGLPLLTQLQRDIGNRGSVIVWYEPFEKTRNEELGQMFPEYASFMEALNARVVDLMTPFANNWYMDKDFFGSASIKKVLPVLVSDLSYKELEIQEGASASRIWTETVLQGKNQDTKEKIMKDLHDYCHLDTLAMVQLYDFLRCEVGEE